MRPANSYHSIYDRRSLIRIIRRTYREKGDLSWSGMRDTSPDILSATHYHFGSWRRAVYAAGINYKLEKRVRNWEWDRDRVRETLLRCHRRGEPMNYNDFERRHRNLLHIALYYFGIGGMPWPRSEWIIGRSANSGSGRPRRSSRRLADSVAKAQIYRIEACPERVAMIYSVPRNITWADGAWPSSRPGLITRESASDGNGAARRSSA